MRNGAIESYNSHPMVSLKPFLRIVGYRKLLSDISFCGQETIAFNVPFKRNIRGYTTPFDPARPKRAGMNPDNDRLSSVAWNEAILKPLGSP